VTNRPNGTLDSKLQLSSSLSTVTGSSADMIEPNAMGMLEKLPGTAMFWVILGAAISHVVLILLVGLVVGAVNLAMGGTG
jgi:hypothetical protein